MNDDNMHFLSPTSPEWVITRKSDTKGELSLCNLHQYIILFVLEGCLKLDFRMHHSKKIDSNHWIIVNSDAISKVLSEPGTTVLIFIPPLRISSFFIRCSKACHISYTHEVPTLPAFQEWVHDLMQESFEADEQLDFECRRKYCSRFAAIINSLSPFQTQEAHIPFYACSMSGELKCKDKGCSSIYD